MTTFASQYIGKGNSVTWFPGLTSRRAASAHRWAALMTSAFRPVTGLSWGRHRGQVQKLLLSWRCCNSACMIWLSGANPPWLPQQRSYEPHLRWSHQHAPRGHWTQKTRRHKVRRAATANCFLFGSVDWHNNGSLHLHKVPIFQDYIGVTFQRGEVTYAVVDWHTGGERDAWGRQNANDEGETETLTEGNLKVEKTKTAFTFLHVFLPFEDFTGFCCDEFISFLTEAEHWDSRRSGLGYFLQSLCRTKWKGDE